jgi:hypothetical protein
MLVRTAITEREKCDRKIAESRGDAPLFEDERRVFGGGIHVDDPLEDVYQAALRIVFSSTWKPEPNWVGFTGVSDARAGQWSQRYLGKHKPNKQ